MESTDRMSLLEIEGQHFGIPRSLSPIQTSKVSVDQLNDYWSHSSDSGVGQDYSVRTNTMQPIQQSSMGCKLQVKHVTQLGTQCGLLVPKYHVHNHSKCIMCKDCGIFFSYDAFLGHSHDKHGRKRHRPLAPQLELDEENPNTEQLKTWQEFIVKIGQTTGSNMKIAADGDSRKTNRAEYHRVKVRETDAASNEENIHGGGALLSDFDKNIQETVSASERLLRETSQYLHSSTEKLRHRRQKSLRNQQLLPKALLQSDSTSSSASKHVQPVIKDLHSAPSSRRPNRKFLEKYLEKSRDSFQLLTDSMTMSSKADSLRVSEDSGLHSQPDPLGDVNSAGGVEREIDLGGGGDVLQKTTSPRPVSPGKTPQGKSKMLQEHFNRNDPLFIVQTAQELLSLAAHKMQEKDQSSPGGIDWQKKYEAERELRKEKENRIRELEGLYQEETKRRQNAEVQLRAIRLQKL